MCMCERYGKSVVLAWVTDCGCAAARLLELVWVVVEVGGFVEEALLPKSQRNVRFGFVSVLTYRPADCLSFTLKFHFSFLRSNLKVMKWGIKKQHWEARPVHRMCACRVSVYELVVVLIFVRACACMQPVHPLPFPYLSRTPHCHCNSSCGRESAHR